MGGQIDLLGKNTVQATCFCSAHCLSRKCHLCHFFGSLLRGARAVSVKVNSGFDLKKTGSAEEITFFSVVLFFGFTDTDSICTGNAMKIFKRSCFVLGQSVCQ